MYGLLDLAMLVKTPERFVEDCNIPPPSQERTTFEPARVAVSVGMLLALVRVIRVVRVLVEPDRDDYWTPTTELAKR